jgi:ferredoxin
LIIAEQKPVATIIKWLEGYRRILIAGCGTCVTVCLAGGEKEALTLASLLELYSKKTNLNWEISVVTPKRQCDAEFLDEIAPAVAQAEVVLSMACGAGVQFMAERFGAKPVLPALDTKFIGVTQATGIWTEMCQGCGECVLEKTGGICPVTRCSKSNFNGPCGGSVAGKCEINPELDCGWQLIYNKLKELGRLEQLAEIIGPKDWSKSRDGGPRKVVRPDVIETV